VLLDRFLNSFCCIAMSIFLQEIKDAIKLEEARRAAMVKNLYRLRRLRLSRTQAASTQSEK
jgi:hypothetical protein